MASIKSDINKAIIEYVEKKVAKEFDNAKQKMIDDFVKDIEVKRSEIIAGVTMRITKMYQIQSLEDKVVITVEDRR